VSLRQQAIGGVKWTTVATVTQALVGILKLSVLARYLDKSDFGLMALVMFVLGFMQLFMDMGISTAILHKQEISRKEYGSLYWINFLISTILYAVVLLLTGPIANFYKEPELSQLLPIMGISLILAAIGRQFKTIEQKDLNFKFISIVTITGAAISLIVAIVLAIEGFGVYALVYSALVQHICTNSIFFLVGVRKHGLLFRLRFEETKVFLKIGLYHVSGQVINYFNKDLDILLIGKLYGAEILGGYSLAKQLVIRPFRVVNPILTRVAAPLLARFQEDLQ
jgi:O-antigen/teichoic acid export membrane protein